MITCEVVCHGVPSMKAFKQYIYELELKHSANVKQIVFRDKSMGWKNNHIAIFFDNNEVVREPSVSHLFHGGYLNGYYSRPSCGSCKYACLPRVADITLADYWKYTGKLRVDNPDSGISLIVCSTEKGDEQLKRVRGIMQIENATQKEALKSCRHLTHPPIESHKRKNFFKLLDQYGFEVAVKQCSHQSFFEKVRIKASRGKQRILNYLR